MKAFVVVMLIIFLFYEFRINRTQQATVGGYTTKYFPLSSGFSLEMFHKMKIDGLSDTSLRDFLMMEDMFLKMEKDTVCMGVSYSIQGQSLSQQIKERFRAYNFDYHNPHLKQMAEPSKNVNSALTC